MSIIVSCSKWSKTVTVKADIIIICIDINEINNAIIQNQDLEVLKHVA